MFGEAGPDVPHADVVVVAGGAGNSGASKSKVGMLRLDMVLLLLLLFPSPCCWVSGGGGCTAASRSRCQSTWGSFARSSGSSSLEPSMRGGVGHLSEVCKESSAFVKSVNTTLKELYTLETTLAQKIVLNPLNNKFRFKI